GREGTDARVPQRRKVSGGRECGRCGGRARMGATPAARSTAAWPSAKAKLEPSCVSCWHSGGLMSWPKKSSGRSRMGRASVRRPMPGAQRNVKVRRQGDAGASPNTVLSLKASVGLLVHLKRYEDHHPHTSRSG